MTKRSILAPPLLCYLATRILNEPKMQTTYILKLFVYKYAAFLKVHGRKEEAKQHLLELYLGLALYFLGFIAFLLLSRFK
ncbi:hypothetical protein [Cellulophaga sp. Z1A5H]|uniref:hypothetical protein n=1 Tax=Cellulophaga sp. Z1A5H TaxID=2687291 RepID=UPI0013FD9F5B|nr:hypothetical protein [Cellulophaga sp. Z1A5H]